MTIKQSNPQASVTVGSLFGTAVRTINNGLSMVDNAFIAGERVTYIAASKASNMADISDIADTLKLVIAKKELNDTIKQLGVTVADDGTMSFE